MKQKRNWLKKTVQWMGSLLLCLVIASTTIPVYADGPTPTCKVTVVDEYYDDAGNLVESVVRGEQNWKKNGYARISPTDDCYSKGCLNYEEATKKKSVYQKIVTEDTTVYFRYVPAYQKIPVYCWLFDTNDLTSDELYQIGNSEWWDWDEELQQKYHGNIEEDTCKPYQQQEVRANETVEFKAPYFPGYQVVQKDGYSDTETRTAVFHYIKAVLPEEYKTTYDDVPHVIGGNGGWSPHFIYVKSSQTTPSQLASVGIYLWQYENGMIEGGAVVNSEADTSQLLYRWLVYDVKNNQWIQASDWSSDYGIHYHPSCSGDYLVYCEVKDTQGNTVNTTVGVNYRHAIQAICQMPNPSGNGYLIGIQSFNNPGYSYEMQILDCNLYMQGKDAWIYSTGKCGTQGNTLWTTWQPKTGYYWTLFNLYDASGNLIDQQCYGFTNAEQDLLNKVRNYVKIAPLGTMPGGAIFERMDKTIIVKLNKTRQNKTIIVNGKLENKMRSRNNEK